MLINLTFGTVVTCTNQSSHRDLPLTHSMSSYNRYGFVTFETEEEADKVKDKVLQ